MERDPSASGPSTPDQDVIAAEEAIAGWAEQSLRRLGAARIQLPGGPLAVRSHCDGHLLTHAAADLLLGRRGGPVATQLYNEWPHQMVLLRDALLPFTNWQDVPHPAWPGRRAAT